MGYYAVRLLNGWVLVAGLLSSPLVRNSEALAVLGARAPVVNPGADDASRLMHDVLYGAPSVRTGPFI